MIMIRVSCFFTLDIPFCEVDILLWPDPVFSFCVADHFEIYSKPKTLPLVAFGLKKTKDKDSGELVDR